MSKRLRDFEEIIENGPFSIKFPAEGAFAQDEEFCEVKYEDGWRKIRFHDYDQVYNVPGLYETIFYRTLRCNSPNRVTNVLDSVLQEKNIDPETLKVLDLGAGNGPNLLLVIAALGFGDIPTKAFQTAFDFIEPGGWVAFNLHEDFVNFQGSDGFPGLINDLMKEKKLKIEQYRRYLHRYSVTGEPIYYVAIVAQKSVAQKSDIKTDS